MEQGYNSYHRRKEFDLPEEKLEADAQGLIDKAQFQSERLGTVVKPINFAQRADDDINALRKAIAKKLNPRVLTAEQKEITLQTLAARFAANEHLHKGVEWTRVKSSLEAKPEALWSINEMEKAGHEPDVYNADAMGFDIGTCSKESPKRGRDCVFDRHSQIKIKKDRDRTGETFNGSAMKMAKDMGIDLMDPTLYLRVLQRKGKFDMQTWCWLKSQPRIGDIFSRMLVGGRDDHGARVDERDPSGHDDNRSWRGSLRVEWAA